MVTGIGPAWCAALGTALLWPAAAAASVNYKLSGGPTAVVGDVSSFQISADSAWAVYRADQDANDVFELYSRTIDGSGTEVKLNGVLPGGGNVLGFEISPDSTRVVYLADQDADNVLELYSRAIDGSGSAVKLNAGLVSGGDVFSGFQISADSMRVVYRADQDVDDVFELYSRAIDGSGVAVKLNAGLISGGDVSDFRISADSTRVVYLADQNTDEVSELYSRAIDGSGAAVQLNAAMVSGGDVLGFQISADSTRVVYRADRHTDDVFEVYSSAIDGSGSAVKLNEVLPGGGDVLSFEISADSTWVVYRADQDANEVFELYSRAIDGSGSAVKLNGALVSGGDVLGFRISRDSMRVVYRAAQDTVVTAPFAGVVGVFELYSRAIDGSGSAVKLNGALATGGNVSDFQISADSTRVVYQADQDADERYELYGRAIDGSGVSSKLNEALVAAGDVFEFQISTDSTRVVYRADQDTDGSFELYSRPIDGSGVASKLNGALVAEGDASAFQMSTDSMRVVYMADEDVDEVFELYSRAIDGSGAQVKLNGALPTGGNVGNPLGADIQISPDSTRAVYIAAQDTDGVLELYSRAIDGSGSAVKLNGALAPRGSVFDFRISADSTRVVYWTGQWIDEIPGFAGGELYSRAIDGSGPAVKLGDVPPQNFPISAGFPISADSMRVVYQAYELGRINLYSRVIDGSGVAVKVNGTLVAGGEVMDFQVSADSTRVVYRADQDANDVFELYSRAIDGSGSAVKLNGTPVAGGDVFSGFLISADSTRVVYWGTQDAVGVSELYSRAIDGSGSAVKLNGALVAGGDVSSLQLSDASTRVVYVADQDVDEMLELYSRAIDGSGVAVKLNGPLVADGDVFDFQISADATRVVYRADQDADEVFELYSRAIDGSGSAVKLNGPMVAGGDVPNFQYRISADSTRVAYRADQDANEVFELYSRAIDGSGAPLKLNAGLVGGGDVSSFQISADSTWVAYTADQDADNVFELYGRAIDGPGSVAQLNGLLVAGGVGEFQIGPDSRVVAYGANQDGAGLEIWATASECGDAAVEMGEDCDAGSGNGSAGSCCDAECTSLPATTPCAGDGLGCTLDQCDGLGFCTHPTAPMDTVCRAGVDVCDADETCNGSSTACPADVPADNSTLCRPGTGVCDAAEYCTGSSMACPADELVAPNTICRAASGDCDVAELCTGLSPSCPVDGVVAAGTSCTTDGDVCTADQCNGAGMCAHPDNSTCENTSTNLPPGGTVSTDPEADGATPSDPVETSITVPGGGTVSIEERPFTNSPDGFFLFGNEVEIDAPNATPANPLVMAFRLDASVLFPQPFGQDEIDVGYPFVFKDSALVANCSGVPVVASPDPCIESRILQGDGDVIITVRTSTASLWQFAVPSGECPDTVDGGCVTGFQKAFLLVKENVPGKEKLIAKLGGGPALEQTDLGNPLMGAEGGTGTVVSLCIYDGNGDLAGELVAGGPTSTCADGALCWKSIGAAPNDPNGPGKGYAYKDTNAATDGLQKLLCKGGDAGSSKAIIKAKGTNLPLGIPAALQSSTQATIQLRSSDGECLSATVTEIKKQEAGFFKGK